MFVTQDIFCWYAALSNDNNSAEHFSGMNTVNTERIQNKVRHCSKNDTLGKMLQVNEKKALLSPLI